MAARRLPSGDHLSPRRFGARAPVGRLLGFLASAAVSCPELRRRAADSSGPLGAQGAGLELWTMRPRRCAPPSSHSLPCDALAALLVTRRCGWGCRAVPMDDVEASLESVGLGSSTVVCVEYTSA